MGPVDPGASFTGKIVEEKNMDGRDGCPGCPGLVFPLHGFPLIRILPYRNNPDNRIIPIFLLDIALNEGKFTAVGIPAAETLLTPWCSCWLFIFLTAGACNVLPCDEIRKN